MIARGFKLTSPFKLRSLASPIRAATIHTASIDRVKVKKIIEGDDVLGKVVVVKGWVRTVRDQKKFAFIEINDGSTLTGIQAVAEAEIDSYSEIAKLSTGII